MYVVNNNTQQMLWDLNTAWLVRSGQLFAEETFSTPLQRQKQLELLTQATYSVVVGHATRSFFMLFFSVQHSGKAWRFKLWLIPVSSNDSSHPSFDLSHQQGVSLRRPAAQWMFCYFTLFCVNSRECSKNSKTDPTNM